VGASIPFRVYTLAVRPDGRNVVRYLSTRSTEVRAGFSRAIVEGLAPDGGLYVPERMPALSADRFPERLALEIAAPHLLRPFLGADPLAPELDAICTDAFVFPAPVVRLTGTPGPAFVLELFHGPTCAFKDFGARFLAASLAHMRRDAGRRLTILVATSNDTGSAVAAAFHGQPSVDVVLLYPKGLVSPRQAHQLACWGGNVRTFAVSGTFDDCQRMAKAAFRDPGLGAALALSSANSINLGRLLPQMAYYASASLEIWRAGGRRPNFIIPSGNLGNAVACVWAREAGLPIGDIVLATNQNCTIPDYLETGEWRPRPSVATLASAMDVGDPSNMERLRWLFPEVATLRRHVSARSVSDDEIRATISADAAALDHVWCPHTATAAHVYHQLSESRVRDPWVLVATAHPAKFSEIVEPLIGREIPVPPALERILRLPRQEEDLPATIDALRARLLVG
jgi:threonine synthase